MTGSRVQGSGFRNLMFLLSFVLLLLYPVPSTLFPAFAATSTPSAKSQESTSSGILDDFQAKIDQIKKEIASKAATLKQEVGKNLQNQALFGTIKSVDTSSLSMNTKKGDKTVKFDEYTNYLNQNPKATKKSKYTIKDFSSSERIVAIGDIDDRGEMLAKRLIKVPNPQEDKKIYKWGSIQTVEGNNLTIISQGSEVKQFNLSIDTSVYQGAKELKVQDLKSGTTIIIVSEDNENADFIYLTGTQALTTATPTPKPSPSLKPTSSPKPSATPKS